MLGGPVGDKKICTQCQFGGVQSGWDEVGVGSACRVGAGSVRSVKASASENYLTGACLPSVYVLDLEPTTVQALRGPRDIFQINPNERTCREGRR